VVGNEPSPKQLYIGEHNDFEERIAEAS